MLAGPALTSDRLSAASGMCDETRAAHVHLAENVDGASVGYPGHCLGCDIRDCHVMLGCADMNAALAHGLTTSLVQVIVSASEGELIGLLESPLAPPTLPPPKA